MTNRIINKYNKHIFSIWNTSCIARINFLLISFPDSSSIRVSPIFESSILNWEEVIWPSFETLVTDTYSMFRRFADRAWFRLLSRVSLSVLLTIGRIYVKLTDTGENVQKWTRVFSTRRRVILVARTRRKKREENSVSTFGRFRLWTSFESQHVSVNI